MTQSHPAHSTPKRRHGSVLLTYKESEWPSQRGEKPPCTRNSLPSLKRWRKAGPSSYPCHCTPTSWRGQPKVGTSLFSLTDAWLHAQGLPGTHQTSWPPSGGLNWEENVRHRPLAQWKESRVHPNYCPTHCSGVQSELLPEESISPVLWESSALTPVSVCTGHPPLSGPRRKAAV